MTTTLHLFLFGIALFACSLTLQTQGSQSDLIENSIKSKEPAWELSSKKVKRESTTYKWKSGEQRVDIRVYVTDSPQKAAAKLSEFSQYVPVTPKERLKSLGDEALLYQGRNTNDCMILFRGGNVFVHLNASSAVNGKRFAKHLAEILDKDNNPNPR